MASKFTACIDLFESVGDPSTIPEQTDPLLYNYAPKRLMVSLFLGVRASTTMLDLAKQVALVVGASSLKRLDEEISNGRMRNKAAPHASARAPKAGKAALDAALAEIEAEREASDASIDESAEG